MTPTAQLSFPGENEIACIAALTNAAERNRQITDSYSKLSAEIERRIQGQANWCTYATWASRQAGVTIRHEDLVNVLRDRIHGVLRLRGFAEALLERVEEDGLSILQIVMNTIEDLGPLRRSSEAVGRGNRKVFEEIGLVFSRWLTMFPDIHSISDADLLAFGQQLTPGAAPEGQDMLREAFTNYRNAAAISDGPERAQLMLLADLQIGFHEQIRLQPDIKEALDGALLEPGDIADFLHEKLTGHEGRIGRLMRAVWGEMESPARRLSEMLARHIHEEVRILITENLMSLWLPPDQELRLGRDLTRPFPEALRTLTDPALLKMLEQFQSAPDSSEQSGVKDWANFKDRMGFIACLFRSYIDDRNLYGSPAARE
ncbi:MAG TPA: hypothetical protein VFT60_00415 [Bryobacteraceae bacterium]|nr:hypothetical protein [Bryobacteraceae bacterium]